MVVSEGWEFHFHHNVYFHPNVRTDGFEHLREMFKRCKLIWGIEQDTYQRCVDSEILSSIYRTRSYMRLVTRIKDSESNAAVTPGRVLKFGINPVP